MNVIVLWFTGYYASESESLVIATLSSVKMYNAFVFEGSETIEVAEEGYIYFKDFGPIGVTEK